MPHHGDRPMTFSNVPRLVFWEMTKACPLACVHCRATAQRDAQPGELTTAEGRALIDDLASSERPRPVLILTGGDCLMRADLAVLTAYAKRAGVPVAVAPSVSANLDAARLEMLHANGVRHVSLSLDGAVAATHEGVRQVPGHFEETIAAIRLLRQHGFSVQINTAVMRGNVGELADIAALLAREEVSTWEVFFLIGVGRGSDVSEIAGAEYEDVCHFLVDAAQYGITVRTVEAPFFRRVREWRRTPTAENQDPALAYSLGPLYQALRSRLTELLGAPTSRVLAPTVATRDGKGIIFVAHNGDVYPAGFLPIELGNVRERGLLEIYRDHPLLRSIRAAEFAGRCGTCEFRDLCGGSRARAFAATGDPLGDDPACSFQPAALVA